MDQAEVLKVLQASRSVADAGVRRPVSRQSRHVEYMLVFIHGTSTLERISTYYKYTSRLRRHIRAVTLPSW